MARKESNIEKYNKRLTQEQRTKNAQRAGRAKRPKLTLNANIRSIAKMINEAPAGSDLQMALTMLNIKDAEVSNAAGIALAVYQAAINGDMKAVEKWEKYVGQSENTGPSPDTVIDDDLSRSLKELAEGLESDD